MSVRQKVIVALTTRLGLHPETARIASNHLPFDLMEQIILEVEKDKFTEDSVNRELHEGQKLKSLDPSSFYTIGKRL